MAHSMTPATFDRVQEHLSSEGIFLMGDAQKQGFPIRYASPGFESTYGYTGQDIVGKKCGDLIGGPMILSDPAVLAQAAAVGECSPDEAQARMRFLVERAGEACRVMMSSPNDRVGVALLLNRKSGGQLFVCECLVLCLKHPSLNWCYTVGFQRDITREVSVPALFRACFHGEYNRLLQSRGAALDERRATLLGVGGENVVQYLHEKALAVFSLDVWRTLRSELLASASDDMPAGPAEVGGTQGGLPTPAMPREELGVVAQAPAQPRALAPAPAVETQCTLAGPAAAAPPPGELSLLPPEGALAPAQAQPAQPAYSGLATNGGRQLPRLDQAMEHMKQSNATVTFLAEVGLQQWTEPLLLNGYDDLETLMDMSEEDMRAVGLTRGHASKLKRRLRGLKCLQICAGPGDDAAPTLLQNLHGSC